MRVSHLISVVFFAAWAAFAQTPVAPSGTGTSADPYQIKTLSNLAWISATNSSWSSHFVQTANIDASATAEWDAGKGFAPIGDSTTRFSGIYQGKGYTIKGLTINLPVEDNIGLFGYTDSTAIVDSLGVVESSITGNYSVGALIGYNGNGTVTHCYSSGSVTGYEDFGGLIGVNEGSVVSSYSTSSVTGYSYSGGLVGYNNGGEVRKCYSTGSVEALVEDAGGLVGYNKGDLINSYSIGSVTGKFVVGGLVGDNYGVVSNSYSTGSVTGEDFVGGLVGYNDSTVTSCYWDVESSGTATGIGYDDNSQSVTGLTTAKMKQKNSFVGWDFSTIWRIDEGMNYPKLSAIILMTDGVKPSGKGTSADPYQIKTLSNLAWISATNSSWGSHFIQTADIDASSTAGWDGGKGFAPIGSESTPFSGSYHGKGHTIKGLTIDRSDEIFIGLFGFASSATVDSLGIVECSITGGITAGALLGVNDGGTVSHCYSSGSVTGDFAGGLVGQSAEGGKISNSYSTSSVSGKSSAGGLVSASGDLSEVSNCYSTGTVAGKGIAGGLVGYNLAGKASNSYSTGVVTGDSVVGGLVGTNLYGEVSGCYWDVESSGTATGIGYDDNSQSVTGLTTAKMKQKNSFVGWDFSTIWSIKEGVSYPKLRIFEDESQSISPYLAINTGSLKPVAGGVEISGVRGRLDLYNISGARLTTLNVTSDGFYPLQQQPGLYILRGAGQSWKVLQK